MTTASTFLPLPHRKVGLTWWTGALSVLLVSTAWAQAPTVTSVAPKRNAPAAPRATSVTVGFSQPLSNTAATQQALRVFSQQAGGRKAGMASVSGSTLSFDPSTDFKPGETVFATLTGAAQSSGGQRLAAPQVFQFTTATSPSPGTFAQDAGVSVASRSGGQGSTLGDLDGDGDLDLLVADYDKVLIRLNNGTGAFSGSQEVAVNAGVKVVAADVDGDGALDLLALGGSTVGVRLNNGAGAFTAGQDLRVFDGTFDIAPGDVDGDGDLDLVAAEFPPTGGSVRVYLNNGSGGFQLSPTQGYVVNKASSVAVGDLDGDGSLDLATATGSPWLNVFHNEGNGTFLTRQAVALGEPDDSGAIFGSVALGDLDGDGDLDFVATRGFNNTVTIGLNDGRGNFTVGQQTASTTLGKVVLGDVDGDGDLDFLTAAPDGDPTTGDGSLVWINNGRASFTNARTVSVAALALGDVDGDGDLDLLAASTGSNTVGIRLNQAAPTSTTTAYRLHAGGGALAASQGQFTADQYYSASSRAFATTAAIAGTPDPALYQSERFSTNGVLSYALPVSNGTYTVVLHFAEIYWTQPGQRVFDIELEGSTVGSHYDILAKVKPFTATTETFQVTVTDGVLNLDLRVPYETGGADQAKLSALEVLRAAAPLNRRPVAIAGPNQTVTLNPSPTSSVFLDGIASHANYAGGFIKSYAWTQLQGPTTAAFSSRTEAEPRLSQLVAGSYIFALVVTDDAGATSPVSEVTITVKPAPYTPVLLLNAGGLASRTTRGDFSADKYPDVNSARATTSAPISGTPDPALYQSERFSTHGALSYAFDVGNGDYVVVMHFAEIYWTRPGQRVFNIEVEGNRVLTNYDILQEVGPFTATSVTYYVTVTDGVLNLDLRVPYETGGADQAKISAIEVLKSNKQAVRSSKQAPAATALTSALRELRVYPNPSAGRFTLACTASQAQAATLTLTDQLGRIVQQQTVPLQAGDNQIPVGVELAAGLYQLALQTADGQRQSQRLLIRP